MTQKPSQTERLYELLKDGAAHRTDEIVDKIYGHELSLARVGARVWDVKKRYGVKIDGHHDLENPKLYWYCMRKVQVPVMPPAFKTAPVAPPEQNLPLFS
jgi:hypothetical protein